MKDSKDAHEGEWDFDGSCAPGEGKTSLGVYPGQETFSLGCFQWEKSRSGHGLKKGKVQYRIKGRIGAEFEKAFESARTFCQKKNAQAEAACAPFPSPEM